MHTVTLYRYVIGQQRVQLNVIKYKYIILYKHTTLMAYNDTKESSLCSPAGDQTRFSALFPYRREIELQN